MTVPRFRFKLQAVLNHREMIEQEHQRAVAALERERARLEESLRACQREITLENSELRTELAHGNIIAARRQAATPASIDARARATAIELAGLLKRLQSARAALLEAAKSRKAVELLRERHFESWRTAEQKADAAAVDEIVVMRAARKDEP